MLLYAWEFHSWMFMCTKGTQCDSLIMRYTSTSGIIRLKCAYHCRTISSHYFIVTCMSIFTCVYHFGILYLENWNSSQTKMTLENFKPIKYTLSEFATESITLLLLSLRSRQTLYGCRACINNQHRAIFPGFIYKTLELFAFSRCFIWASFIASTTISEIML